MDGNSDVTGVRKSYSKISIGGRSLPFLLAFERSKDLRVVRDNSLRRIVTLVRLDSELFVKIEVAAHGKGIIVSSTDVVVDDGWKK